MLQAGKLRHRIVIQERVMLKDSDGNDIVDWQDLFENAIPAEKRDLSVREFISAQAGQSSIRGRFVIRYLSELEGKDGSTMRVLHRGIYYNIHGWMTDPESGLEYMTAPFSAWVDNGGF